MYYTGMYSIELPIPNLKSFWKYLQLLCFASFFPIIPFPFYFFLTYHSFSPFFLPFTFFLLTSLFPFFFLTAETCTLGYGDFSSFLKEYLLYQIWLWYGITSNFYPFFDKLNFVLGGLDSKSKYISTKTKKIHFSEGE